MAGTALVTGAARRIGRAIALELARAGWAVVIHYGGSADDAEATAGAVRSIGGRALALACDLDDAQALPALIARSSSALGPVTCLINNASLFLDDRFGSIDSDRWDGHMSVNLRAPVLLSQAFAAALPEGVEGNIVNIIDQRVWRPTPEFFSYAVSKAALWTATRMMAQALAPRIRVNGIGPGPVLASIHQTAEDFAREVASTLLRRGTTPEEVAKAVRFVLDAPAMTGQMIALDGGQHLVWTALDGRPAGG